MMTTFDTDPNTHTVAAAWASSPLGDPVSGPTELWETVEHAQTPDLTAEADDTPRSIAKHVGFAVARVVAVGAGAALTWMLFDTTPAEPTVVVPGVGGSPAPSVFTESSPSASPQPVVPVQETVLVAPAPAKVQSPAGPATPPAPTPDHTVVVDTPIPDDPPLAEEPKQDEPEPPKPEDPDPEPPKPPVPDDLDFKLPEPKPDPKPEPPVFVPDLPLADAPKPKPKPHPEPEPPFMPHFEIGS